MGVIVRRPPRRPVGHVGNEAVGRLLAERVGQFGAGPVRVAEAGPAHRVEARVPQPLPRIATRRWARRSPAGASGGSAPGGRLVDHRRSGSGRGSRSPVPWRHSPPTRSPVPDPVDPTHAHLHLRLVPARPHRWGVDRGRQLGRGHARARLRGGDGGRRRAGGPVGPGPGARCHRTPRARSGRGRAGRRRSGGGREPVHDPAEPTGCPRGGRRLGRSPGAAAPPRSPLAARRVGPRHRAPARRSGLAPRDHQRPDPPSVRSTGTGGHHHLQRLRHPGRDGPARPDPRRAGGGTDRAPGGASRTGHPPQAGAPRPGPDRAAGRHLLAAGRRRDGLRPRARADPGRCSHAASSIAPGRTVPISTPLPTWWPSRPRGRASATPPSRPPSPDARRWSGITPWPGNWPRWASGGSSRTTWLRLATWLAHPDSDLLDTNQRLAEAHFSLEVMGAAIADLLDGAGWLA